MKALLYKILLVTLLIPGSTYPINDLNGKHTREKKLSREFNVSATSNLKISNSYGNIDISTWEKNKVVIEVFIKTNGNDAEKVQQKLEEIDVEFNQSSSGVSAETHFSKSNRSWWNNLLGGSSNVNMEVNYVIRAPERNNFDLSNDYGGIYIDRLLGNSRISCDYGKIDILELHGNSNLINFDYTRNSHIGYVKNAEINADYSEYEIEEAERLKINADYSTSKIKKVARLEFNCDYGSIQVDKVKQMVGNGDYLSTKIGRVFTSADLSVDYGNATIEKVMEGARDIKVNSNYAGVKIGFDARQPFNFQVDSNYGSVKGLDALEVQKHHDQSTKKSFRGYHLSQDSGRNISVKSNYASVQFNKN